MKRRQKYSSPQTNCVKERKDQYFFDKQRNRYYRDCDREELNVHIQNSLLEVLLNPLRTGQINSTKQMIEAVKYSQLHLFPKQSYTSPLFIFQTNQHINILTRTNFEIFALTEEEIKPLQSVTLPGEVLHFSFSQQFPHLQFTNNDFVLLCLSEGQQHMIEYKNGTPSYRVTFNKKVYSISLCSNDVVIGSSNKIELLHSCKSLKVRGKINCIQFPYFTTSNGDLFIIDSLNIFHYSFICHLPLDILSFVLIADYLIIHYLNREMALFDLKTNSLTEIQIPFKPIHFYCQNNYILILSEKEFALGLYDQQGILDWISQESGDFINSVPFIAFDEYNQPKVLIVNSKELKMSL